VVTLSHRLTRFDCQRSHRLTREKKLISLQTKFTTIITKIEQQKSQAEKALAKSEDLFNSLLQRAFKGEL